MWSDLQANSIVLDDDLRNQWGNYSGCFHWLTFESWEDFVWYDDSGATIPWRWGGALGELAWQEMDYATISSPILVALLTMWHWPSMLELKIKRILILQLVSPDDVRIHRGSCRVTAIRRIVEQVNLPSTDDAATGRTPCHASRGQMKLRAVDEDFYILSVG